VIGTWAAETTPHAGDHAALRGTRIVGDVKRVVGSSQGDQVVLKVTEVVGKTRTSKQARAWQGAWVTCSPTMLVPLQ